MKKRLAIVLVVIVFSLLSNYALAQKTKTIFYQDGTEGLAMWDSIANRYAIYVHTDYEAYTVDGIVALWSNPDMLIMAGSNHGTNELFFTEDGGKTWVRDPWLLSLSGLGFKFVDFPSGQWGSSISMEPDVPDTFLLVIFLPWRNTSYSVGFKKWIGFWRAFRIVFDNDMNPIIQEVSSDGLRWR